MTDKIRLLAVEFDDQLLVDGQIDVFTLRQGDDLAGESVSVDIEPLNLVLAGGKILGLFELGQRLRAFADRDLVADLDLKRRDVDLAAVDLKVTVTDDLTSLAAAHCKAEAIGDVVEAGLKLLEQEFARDAGLVGGLLVVSAELGLEGEVDALGLLLLTKLQTVADDLLDFAGLAVLAGGKVALLDGAFLGEALGCP